MSLFVRSFSSHYFNHQSSTSILLNYNTPCVQRIFRCWPIKTESCTARTANNYERTINIVDEMSVILVGRSRFQKFITWWFVNYIHSNAYTPSTLFQWWMLAITLLPSSDYPFIDKDILTVWKWFSFWKILIKYFHYRILKILPILLVKNQNKSKSFWNIQMFCWYYIKTYEVHICIFYKRAQMSLLFRD